MRNLGANTVDSKRIGVVMGGPLSAREASRRSGRAVVEALEQAGYDVAVLDLGPQQEPAEVLRRARFDVAFLALQGRYGENGCVQGLLELLQIPYTGSGVLQSALAADKLKAKELFRLHNVATPAYYALSSSATRERILDAHGSFGYPVIVKPRREGGRVGVTRVNDAEALVSAIHAVSAFDTDVLVERFVPGCEVTVGLLNGRVLGALEVAPLSGVFNVTTEPRLSPVLRENVLHLAERAASALDVSGAVQVDLIVTDNQNEYVLEVNTLPSFADSSPFTRIAEAAGFNRVDLCRSLVDHASLGMKLPTVAQKASVVALNKAEERELRAVAG
jgi:D-alanine-D-alanine ligase